MPTITLVNLDEAAVSHQDVTFTRFVHGDHEATYVSLDATALGYDVKTPTLRPSINYARKLSNSPTGSDKFSMSYRTPVDLVQTGIIGPPRYIAVTVFVTVPKGTPEHRVQSMLDSVGHQLTFESPSKAFATFAQTGILPE
jgi:hypothetical protein